MPIMEIRPSQTLFVIAQLRGNRDWWGFKAAAMDSKAEGPDLSILCVVSEANPSGHPVLKLYPQCLVFLYPD